MGQDFNFYNCNLRTDMKPGICEYFYRQRLPVADRPACLLGTYIRGRTLSLFLFEFLFTEV